MNSTRGHLGPQRPQRVLRPRTPPAYDDRVHGAPDVTDAGAPPPGIVAPPITAKQWAIDTVLDRLRSWRPCGDGYIARCPAHADGTPSLSINETADGVVLIYCHAGCGVDKILAALGLQAAHLYTSEFARRCGHRRDGRTAPTPGTWRPTKAEPFRPHSSVKDIFRAARRDASAALPALANDLRLPVAVLKDFRIGFDGRAYAFPECDHGMQIVGVTYRSPTGKKWCVKDSVRGLTIPVATRFPNGPFYIAEGATDAMAMHSLQLRVIGRPAATPTDRVFNWIVRYVADKATAGVVVVGDNDRPGQNGRRVGRDAAEKLARRLAATLPQGSSIAWAVPPVQFKDVREQVIDSGWGAGLLVTEVRHESI